MSKMHSKILFVALAFLGTACGDITDPPIVEPPLEERELALEKIADGLFAPVYLTAPQGDNRLFVAELNGRIRIIEEDELLPDPFLDITDRVSFGQGERGLLGMAFHPYFEANGVFFVNYTDDTGNNLIERYRLLSGDPYRADPASGELILEIEQPQAYHNGGELVFGPDGMLYVGVGDGAIGGDPQKNAQDTHTLLGAILRIDPLGGDPYSIPLRNPFADGEDGAPEIWHYGLRHPWRFTFDEPSGLLYLPDLGEHSWEEINIVPADEGGLNFGWPILEGTECFYEENCDPEGTVEPVLTYPDSEGCAIIGGYVYRGQAIPWLEGVYLYADHCHQWVRGIRYENGSVSESAYWPFHGEVEHNINSFGMDADGEIYLLNLGGGVFRLVEREEEEPSES